ncbi:hypothetical protein Zmor_021463 [Zophobas morio]|uniref:Uncharacterized protein n=1 Tax=Zophobas morio TaxID=2755281 RepID=A0AA38I9G3_9CUCU|nr:hypothetical protein Zmor_021463 [Zophobas morio]
MMECWKKRTVLEKKSLVTLVVLVTFVIGLITLILLITEPAFCYTSSCYKASEHIHRLMNPRAKPCDNFYDFVCGNAFNNARQPNDRSPNIKILKEIISEPIGTKDVKSLQLQKLFYQSCTNLEVIDVDNDTTFANIISKLGGWPVVSGNNWNESAFDFAEFMVELREKGLQHDWFLEISVYSNRGQSIILEINVPDNANKIEEETAEAYIDLMTKSAVAFGALEDVAKSQMPEVMYFENKLVNLIEKIHNENERLYSHQPLHLITIAEVQQKWQNINWLELINHLTKKKLSDDQLVAFYVENYMPELDKLLKQTTKRTQVNYVMWKLVEAYSPFLSKRIRDMVHNYVASTNQTDLWYKDREDFCFEEAKSYFQYALEAEYLRRHVTKTKSKNIEEMMERILKEIKQHLREVNWMDENMRRAAISRLENMSYIIGGPEEMYYAEQFDKDFGVGNLEFKTSNIIQITTDIFHKALDTLYSKKYEDTNYLKYTFYELVTSQEIAFYQNFNLLWIPAGVLHDFFYDDDRPNYLNYGTMGTTIAYEMLHGLYARLFRTFTLWSNSTLENFNQAVRCLKNCSEGLPQFKEVNCGNLLETMSDYIAINLSYKAYQKLLKQSHSEKKLLDLSFSNDQLFWLAYGTSMCHLPVPELNYSRFDHMMQSFRIVGPFRNSPHFSKDFRCELGSTMNPRNKCQIL